jgi:hypothetical protein
MDSPEELIRIPACWMQETQAAYRQYCDEWRREEAERVLGTGDSPEEPESWSTFFREYLYAELEAATGPTGA